MRHLVDRIGAETILRRGGLKLCSHPRRDAASPDRFIGNVVSRAPVPQSVLGAAAPFGRIQARQLETLATAAGEAGAAELRLTPWRAILVPGLAPDAAAQLAATSAAAGLIVDGGDPRLRVAACPGAPGCHRGTTPVLDHAARLSALLPVGQTGNGIVLHVSGCSKGCAHRGRAPLTLVGHDGLYDVVTDGSAADRPSRQGLGFEDAVRFVTSSGARERRP